MPDVIGGWQAELAALGFDPCVGLQQQFLGSPRLCLFVLLDDSFQLPLAVGVMQPSELHPTLSGHDPP